MKPAFSVLFFTVCAGAGSGLLVWLLLEHLWLNWVADGQVNIKVTLICSLLGLSMLTLGLLSSTLHLANPKNAWRAFSRFRTSWLSREGVFAVLFYPVFFLYLIFLYKAEWVVNLATVLLGVVAVLISIATVYCTGMIYASLKPIRQWHNAVTVPSYLILSLMSGAVLMHAVAMIQEYESVFNYSLISIVALSFGLVVKFIYFRVIGMPGNSSINSATGFSQARVRLMDAGHTSDTFLTNEFGFDVATIRLLRLRWLACGLAFLLPALFLYFSVVFSMYWIWPMALTMLIGLLLERWLFFAEARHVVRLYHGDQTN